jgi:hypothetical protein
LTSDGAAMRLQAVCHGTDGRFDLPRRDRLSRLTVQELLPLVSGLAAGAALGLVRPSLRFPVGALLAVLLGTLATVLTGEMSISPAFLLIDIPLVALASVLGLLAARQVRSPSRAG